MTGWRDDPVLATVSPVELAAMDRALELAALGPEHGPNPRVGCVVLGLDGAACGRGFAAGEPVGHRLVEVADGGPGAPSGDDEVTIDVAGRDGDVGQRGLSRRDGDGDVEGRLVVRVVVGLEPAR